MVLGRRKALLSVPALIALAALLLLSLSGAEAAANGSNWTQSDWSGGVGPSTLNQFSSSNNIQYSSWPLSLSRPAGWYSQSWGYRKKLTVNPARVTGPLTDYPVYVDLSGMGSDFFTNVKADGSDIVVTSSDGSTKLPRQLFAFDKAGQRGALYFKAASLSNVTANDFYVYYGNAAGAETNSTSTWDSGYKGVWELEEDPSGTAPQMKDSTSSGNWGTTAGGMTAGQSVAGRIGKAVQLDGTDDSVTVDNIAVDTTALHRNTVEFWMYWGGADGQVPLGWNTPYNLLLQGDGFGFSTDDGNIEGFSGTAPLANSWHHVVAVFPNAAPDDTNAELWVDGQKKVITHLFGSGPSDRTVTAKMLLGTLGAGGSDFGGIIDEVRVSNLARSADWIKTSYNNQGTPGTFYTIGAAQTQYASSGLLTSNVFRPGQPGNAVRWGQVSWSGSQPAWTGLAVELSLDGGVTWGPAVNGGSIGLVSDSIRYRVTMTSASGTASPKFSSIGFDYSYLADAGVSSVTASPVDLLSDGIDETTVSVALKAFNGEPLSGHVLDFTSDRASDTFSEDEVYTDDSGMASVSMWSTSSGTSSITVTDVGDSIELSQKPQVHFSPAVDPYASDVQLGSDTCVADNSTQVEIKVILKDTDGAAVAGHAIEIKSDRTQDTLSQPLMLTDANGVVIGKIKSSEAGFSTITATDVNADVELYTTPVLEFTEADTTATDTTDNTSTDTTTTEEDTTSSDTTDYSDYTDTSGSDQTTNDSQTGTKGTVGRASFSKSTLTTGTGRTSKLKAGDKVAPGEVLAVIMNVNNSGKGPGQNVRVSAVIPENCTYVTNSMTGTGFDERTKTWTLGTVGKGKTVRVSYQMQVKKTAKKGSLVAPGGLIRATNATMVRLGVNPSTGSPNNALEVGEYSIAANGSSAVIPLVCIAIAFGLMIAGGGTFILVRMHGNRLGQGFYPYDYWYR
jgi:uncharacterized repeat protein (TIGR01451 family)